MDCSSSVAARGTKEPIPTEPIDRNVSLRFDFTEPSVGALAETAELTVVESSSNSIHTGPIETAIVDSGADFGVVALQHGEYLFQVLVLGAEGFAIGVGEKQIEISNEEAVSIPVNIVGVDPEVEVPIDITVEIGGDCLTRTPFVVDDFAYVYQDDLKTTYALYVASGWFGDVDKIEIDDGYASAPHSGESSMKVVFHPGGAPGWSGVYHLPVRRVKDDWSNVRFGFDLTGAQALEFWAKGDVGGEEVEFVFGGVQIAGVSCSESIDDELRTGKLTLSSEWTRYEFSLAGESLEYVIGGFGWVATDDDNPTGCMFYLDDIRFVY